jgi:hypothetical protein
MTTRQLKSAIKSALSALGSGALTNTLNNQGYIYTAYVSTLIADALQTRLQGIVTVNIQNPTGGPFNFPGGPSKIYRSGASWYQVVAPKGIWEMHLCCFCDGFTGLPHELDILIIQKTAADYCRRDQRNPSGDEIDFLVECKNVASIDYGIGREFIGLCFEFPLNAGRVWRGSWRRGALIGSLSNAPGLPSGFRVVSARKLLAHSFIVPKMPLNVLDFQDEFIKAVRKIFV